MKVYLFVILAVGRVDGRDRGYAPIISSKLSGLATGVNENTL